MSPYWPTQRSGLPIDHEHHVMARERHEHGVAERIVVDGVRIALKVPQTPDTTAAPDAADLSVGSPLAARPSSLQAARFRDVDGIRQTARRCGRSRSGRLLRLPICGSVIGLDPSEVVW
jgi:hypothetical protein